MTSPMMKLAKNHNMVCFETERESCQISCNDGIPSVPKFCFHRDLMYLIEMNQLLVLRGWKQSHQHLTKSSHCIKVNNSNQGFLATTVARREKKKKIRRLCLWFAQSINLIWPAFQMCISVIFAFATNTTCVDYKVNFATDSHVTN